MTRKDRTTYSNDRSADQFTIETKLEIWGTNSTLLEKKAKLEVTTFDLDSKWEDKWEQDVILASNASTELYSGSLPGQPIRTKKSEIPRVLIVSARLLDIDGTVLGRYSNWYDYFLFQSQPLIFNYFPL